MLRRVLLAGLVIAPVSMALHWLASIGATADFVLASVALIPLAWLIGEATEHAADHTGPGIGGFLNATFGNAPELIIALIAVDRGLDEVVRGSLTGSVVGNLLLVLGASLCFGGDGEIDRPSTVASLALIALSLVLFLIPAVAVGSGSPNRHSLAVVSLPVAVTLLVVYLYVTWRSLRRHAEMHVGEDDALTGWSFRKSVVVLAVATAATAVVAEILVGSLEDFAHRAGLTDFFVAAVIVAVVGNAAEHGGAVLVAIRGKIMLAAEIATSSAAQVAVFLVPAVAIISWAIKPLALSFRPAELGALFGALAVSAVALADGKTSRLRGALLVIGYAGAAVLFYKAGNR